MLSLTHELRAVVNGVTYYGSNTDTPESLIDGYGTLINEYFGYDPLKTFNGKDIFIRFNTLHLALGVSLYF
jgi:hypothetical protein